MRRLLLALLLGLTCSSLASAAPALVPVTTCGQTVARGTIGYLTGDLDCTGFTATPGAVMLSRGSRLDLGGFTITGALFGIVCGELGDDGMGLFLVGKCRVVGAGGTILNSEAHGILANGITVTNLTILDVGQEGLAAYGPAKLTNVTITNSGTEGARLIKGAKVVASSITGSGESGILSERRVTLVDSTVTGNSLNGAECPYPHSCADLFTERRPSLKNSTCGTSRMPGGGSFTWGVCTLD